MGLITQWPKPVPMPSVRRSILRREVDLRRGLMCDGFVAAGACPIDGRLHHTEDQPLQPGAEQSGTTRVAEILGIRRRRLLVAESLPNLAEDRAGLPALGHAGGD